MFAEHSQLFNPFACTSGCMQASVHLHDTKMGYLLHKSKEELFPSRLSFYKNKNNHVQNFEK
jgi:hypothetical protein